MKTTVDIFNEMWLTYHWASPYEFAQDFDVHLMILDSMDEFATIGEYH